ncbi:MAG: LuxR C-terminal-related transcriptional regulator [Dermatophilaceae bacterium]
MPATKVRVPASPTTLVLRPRLLELIGTNRDDLEGTPDVTFVCGPAGSGKTTLLADWARRRRRLGDAAVAWVSLEAGDNDIHLLWSAILTAIDASRRWTEGSPVRDIDAPRHGMSPGFLSVLVNALDQTSPPVVLILDDVHELNDLATLRSLDLLLRRLPPRVRVVMAGRFTPALALPRLRLDGQLREIDTAALGFTAPEATALLGAHGVDLDSDDFTILLERTEGWAAGLRMAAMSLADVKEPSEVIANFARNDQAVADYLVGEVLAHQDESIRAFLLATCVCERLTADLARELSGRDDSGAVLEGLVRSNFVMVRFGGHEKWYRYHPLMREYLLAELARQSHDLVAVHHRAAALWFARRDETMAAIEHAIDAGDPDLTATLLEANGLQHVLAGEGARLRRLLDKASEEVVRRPEVALILAASALEGGDPAAADVALARMPDALAGHDLAEQPSPDVVPMGSAPVRSSAPLRVLHTAIGLQHARLGGESSTAVAMLASKAVTTGDVDLDLITLMNRGVTWVWVGNADAAEHDLRQALLIAKAKGRDRVALHCLASLASVESIRMNLVASERLANEAIDLATSRGWTSSVPCAEASLALGWAAYLRLDDATVTAVRPSVHLLAESPDPQGALAAELFDAVVDFDRGEDRHAVVAAMRDLWKQYPAGHIHPALVAGAALIEQRMALQVGEPTWAAEVVERVRLLLGETGDYRLLQAVRQAHRGRSESAERMLGQVLEDTLPSMTPLTRLEAWIWEARLADRAGDEQRAQAAVVEALHIGAPQLLLRPFVEGGQGVRDLLARGAGRFGHAEGFAARICAAVTPTSKESLESLTTRELELLVELPSLRTADEIAESLFVSVNTVKTHLRGIYRKFGVNNRREAIVLARRRGLL